MDKKGKHLIRIKKGKHLIMIKKIKNLVRIKKVKFHKGKKADMIFVKTFTLADFGPVLFYPKAHNLIESLNVASSSLVIEVLHA